MIELERPELLDSLLEAYTTWYDVERLEGEALPLVARAAFHEHGVTYFLARKAQLWAADRHEYVYFFSAETLTQELARQCLERTYALGEQVVVPDPDHMSSYVVAVFLCDNVAPEAAELIRRYRRRKSFRFSLLGWMEIHSVIIDRRSGDVLSNPDGRKTAKLLKDVLYPPEEKSSGGWRGILNILMKRKCF